MFLSCWITECGAGSFISLKDGGGVILCIFTVNKSDEKTKVNKELLQPTVDLKLFSSLAAQEIFVSS